MQVLELAQAKADDLRYLVRSVQATRVYYVWKGRNAWWSTWSTTYSPGCFHLSLASAKAFCEKRRTQGTVFYIDEIPAVAFHSKDRSLYATEINTKDFFKLYDFAKIGSIAEILPTRTMTLKQICVLLAKDSPLWPRNHRWLDRAHLGFFSGDVELESITLDTKLLSRQSHSYGSQYSLGWYERPFACDSSQAIRLSDLFNKNMGQP